jgi:hypothetical protein
MAVNMWQPHACARRRPRYIGGRMFVSSVVASVQIAGKPIAYERKIFVPDVLVFKDGRIKLPADPSRITSTR